MLISIISLFAKWHYLADLFTHFRIQYLICASLALFYFILIQDKKWLTLSILTLLLNTFFILSVYEKYEPVKFTSQYRNSKILFYNVLSSNKNFDQVLNYLLNSNAEIIALAELTPEWATKLEPLKEHYPYHSIHPQHDNFGIAVYSHIKGKVDKIYLDSSFVPSLLFHSDDLSLLATHPIPPVGTQNFLSRNEHFKAISKLSSEHKNFVVIGDLNCSVFSPFLQDFKHEAKLKLAPKFSAIKGTWSTTIPLLITNLDHILVSSKINISDHRIGPHLGSDHWPIEASIQY